MAQKRTHYYHYYYYYHYYHHHYYHVNQREKLSLESVNSTVPKMVQRERELLASGKKLVGHFNVKSPQGWTFGGGQPCDLQVMQMNIDFANILFNLSPLKDQSGALDLIKLMCKLLH